MTKIILITGATSGIGKACAEKFAQHNHNLIITGRRSERLKTLKDELEKAFKINVLCLNFDIRDKTAVESAINSLTGDWEKIDVLINNAGLAAGLDFVQTADMNDWEQMIDTNVKGLLYISKQVIPLMIQNNKGHIINIGSIAGKEVYPKGSVYCATKHAVDALTKGMRMDLLEYGIRVSQIAPGAVETEFSLVRFKGDKKAAENVYKGFQPLLAENIAEVTYFVSSMPDHVNINDLLIMPTAQANTAQLFKKQPK